MTSTDHYREREQPREIELRQERIEAYADGKCRIPRPGTSPARFYGPRVPGGDPWLQMDDGSWWKWMGSGWVSEAEVLALEARS